MANYEKQVEQEAAYPIPISLYNCYRTVRQEKRGVAIYILLIAFLLPHCPVTVVQRYRDGVCSLLFHLFFIICHPYIPLHLEEMIFYTCIIFRGTWEWKIMENEGNKRLHTPSLDLGVCLHLPYYYLSTSSSSSLGCMRQLQGICIPMSPHLL